MKTHPNAPYAKTASLSKPLRRRPAKAGKTTQNPGKTTQNPPAARKRRFSNLLLSLNHAKIVTKAAKSPQHSIKKEIRS
ncbi:MAG: hypothetical protein ACTTJV_06350 [Ottowia sp.]